MFIICSAAEDGGGELLTEPKLQGVCLLEQLLMTPRKMCEPRKTFKLFLSFDLTKANLRLVREMDAHAVCLQSTNLVELPGLKNWPIGH